MAVDAVKRIIASKVGENGVGVGREGANFPGWGRGVGEIGIGGDEE